MVGLLPLYYYQAMMDQPDADTQQEYAEKSLSGLLTDPGAGKILCHYAGQDEPRGQVD